METSTAPTTYVVVVTSIEGTNIADRSIVDRVRGRFAPTDAGLTQYTEALIARDVVEDSTAGLLADVIDEATFLSTLAAEIDAQQKVVLDLLAPMEYGDHGVKINFLGDLSRRVATNDPAPAAAQALAQLARAVGEFNRLHAEYARLT